MKKQYNKLVRDKIPAICRRDCRVVTYTTLSSTQYKRELFKKLREEVLELTNARPKELPNELADVAEVLRAIASFNTMRWQDIEKARQRKKLERGGFSKKYFLISTEE